MSKMPTLKPAILALSLLASAAAAQQPPSPPALAVPPQELDALRHHQPTRADVHALEVQRFGQAGVAQRQKNGQADVEQLYQQLMRETAPAGGH